LQRSPGETGAFQVERLPGKYYFLLYGPDGEEALIGLRLYPKPRSGGMRLLSFYGLGSRALTTIASSEKSALAGTVLPYIILIRERNVSLSPHGLFGAGGSADTTKPFGVTSPSTACRCSWQKLPESWHYQILWESCEGRCGPLLVEQHEHDSELEAKEALVAFFESYNDSQSKAC
jgi:hypothetical protein